MPEVKDVKPAVTKDEEDDEEVEGKGKKKKKQKEEEEMKRKKELSEEEKQVWKCLTFFNLHYEAFLSHLTTYFVPIICCKFI